MEEAEKPFEYVYQEEKRLKKIRKRFSFSVQENLDVTVPVFVRLKPTEDQSNNDFLTIDTHSSTITITKKNVEKSYKFTHIFKAETNQKEIFDYCTLDYLRGFLKGTRSNVFIFTYGASCSGKTFTIQGDKFAPGILPRLIATVFKSLEGDIDTEHKVRLDLGGSVAERTHSNQVPLEKTIVLTIAKSLLNMSQSKNQFLLLSDLEKLQVDAAVLELAYPGSKHTIWFSYYEIYNDQVYDLLDEPKENRTHLRIVNDRNSTYVEGLKCVQVSSLEEAYLVYIYGRYNLTISCTGVNSTSSRSHSIFTLRVLSHDLALNSSFSVCDLAGTERADRTGNVGLRLREAQRINTSFLTLNRCLRAIRENQSSGVSRRIPYRESKLTKILGPALTTPGTSLAMVVTVSQGNGQAEETESSLKASSVAASIKAKPILEHKVRRGPFADLVMEGSVNWNEVAMKKRGASKTPEQAPKNDEFFTSGTSFMDTSTLQPLDVYKELHEERLKRKLGEEKLADLEKTYKEKINKLENECRRKSAEKRELEEQVEDTVASRTEILRLMKAIRKMKENKLHYESQIKELESINEGLNEMLDDAKDDIGNLQKESQELERTLQEKEQIINIKDYKMHSLEVEIYELEQNLEKNANEIEAYDKQLSAVEAELRKKKTEIMQLTENYEKVEAELRKKKNEILQLTEKYEAKIEEKEVTAKIKNNTMQENNGRESAQGNMSRILRTGKQY